MIEIMYAVSSIAFAVSLTLALLVNQNYAYATLVFWAMSVFFGEARDK